MNFSMIAVKDVLYFKVRCFFSMERFFCNFSHGFFVSTVQDVILVNFNKA